MDIPTGLLIGILIFLILLSGFFSGSETGLMTLNRYRLRHLAQDKKHRGAMLAEKLLEKPDQLIGLILLGNNLVNNLIAILVGLVARDLYGDWAVGVAAFIVTVIMLIFAEVAPKTLAAKQPERVAFPAAYVYWVLIRPFRPLVWLINKVANSVLRLFGVKSEHSGLEALTREELRTVVAEAGSMIPAKHQDMLINILDLESAVVEDIMVPRNEMFGIDLNDEWEIVLQQLSTTEHTRIPLYEDNFDDVKGIIHARRLLPLMSEGKLDREHLERDMLEPYYIPEGTSLNKQLLHFQSERRRIALVVDEYGDIQGLVTLEDILEEIVGDFTTDPAAEKGIFLQHDDSYLIRGSVNVRAINRSLGWNLPLDGPRTLNGVIIEHLQSLPVPGTVLTIDNHTIEIMQVEKNKVMMVQVDKSKK